jgi:putative transposase
MLSTLLNRARRVVGTAVQALRTRVATWTKPATTSITAGTVTALTRSKRQWVIENALLRQQRIVLQRTVKRPRLTRTDRALLVLLASKVRTWREAFLIVKPDTCLRWHRQGFRLFWKRRPRAKSTKPRIPMETVALIMEMATNNRLWGAERIHGELLKLGIHVSKRTIQKYLRHAGTPGSSGQTWATFLRNHGQDIWACDVLQVTDVLFRPLFAFFITDLESRRVVHVGVTRSPTDTWMVQQLREARPYGTEPKFLIRDNDGKFGPRFADVAAGSGIKILKTPHQAPPAHAICERFLGSVRRECLDHVLILSAMHLHRILKDYVAYFNYARPHQGIGQRIPASPEPSGTSDYNDGKVSAVPVLGGLHHEYRWAAVSSTRTDGIVRGCGK